ncbi:DNA primase, partial [Staphylococcus chromogenes]
HFINDKDVFLIYYKNIEETDFTNEYFKRIFNVLRDFYSSHEQFEISECITYINQNEIKEALIYLVDYPLNHEPYENEMNDYIRVMTENRHSDSLESLHEKLREATRNKDLESQKYYLEMIVNKNRNRLKRQD